MSAQSVSERIETILPWVSQSAQNDLRAIQAQVEELVAASRDLLLVSEIAAMCGLIPESPRADGPIPRTRAALAAIGAQP